MRIFSSDHSRPKRVDNKIKIGLGIKTSAKILETYEKNNYDYNKLREYLFVLGTKIGKKYHLEPEGFWFDEDKMRFNLNMKRSVSSVEEEEEKVPEDKKTRVPFYRKERESTSQRLIRSMKKDAQGFDEDKMRKTDKIDVEFPAPGGLKEKPKIPGSEIIDKKKDVGKPEKKKPEEKKKEPGIETEKKKIEKEIEEELTPKEGLDLIKTIIEKIEKEITKKESVRMKLASRKYRTRTSLLKFAFNALDNLEPENAKRIMRLARFKIRIAKKQKSSKEAPLQRKSDRKVLRKRAKFSPITRTDFDVKPSGETIEAFEKTDEGKRKPTEITVAQEKVTKQKVTDEPTYAQTEKAPDGTTTASKVQALIETMQEKDLIGYEDIAGERKFLTKMSARKLDYLEKQLENVVPDGTSFVKNGLVINLGKAISD